MLTENCNRRSFAIIIALLLCLASCVPHYHPAGCEKVTDVATAREEALKREAHESLKIGTKKDAVIRFFESQKIPVRFERNEAIGEIYTHGGCCVFRNQSAAQQVAKTSSVLDTRHRYFDARARLVGKENDR